MNSLESILKSFKIIKKILINKQQQRLMMNIDEKRIKQIMLLLKPFRDVMKMIQTGNSPSLYLVLLCTQTLRDVLKSYDSLVNYDENHDNHESREELDDTDEDLLDELQGKSDKTKYYMSRNIFLFSRYSILSSSNARFIR
jgi:hypothetical protein